MFMPGSEFSLFSLYIIVFFHGYLYFKVGTKIKKQHRVTLRIEISEKKTFVYVTIFFVAIYLFPNLENEI